MNRKQYAVSALVLGVVVVVLAWWRPWSGDGNKKTGDKVASPTTKPSLKKAPDARDTSPSFEVLADDDAVGTLRLEGMVVDDAMVGVPGAVVTLSSNPPRTATTGEDGSFHFDQLGGRAYRLVARSAAGAAGPVTARLTETSDPVTLRVRASSSVEVAVLSALDREPIAGATVELRGALALRATTDGDGVARLTAVPVGRFQIAGWSSGFATARSFVRIGSTATTHRAELLLSPGAQVSGRVLDSAGAPVAEARVLYASVSERRDRAHPLLDAVVTSSDGAFVIPALPKGTWRLSARHKTHAPGTSESITLDGSTSVDGVEIRLEEGAVVRGKVVTADGAPAPHARVRAAASGRGFRGEPPRQTFADDKGLFELEGLSRAEMSIVALDESATSETVVVDTADKAAATAVVLELSLTGRIAGRVLDSVGEPIDGAQVQLMPDFRRGGGRGGDRRAARSARQDFRLRGFATELTDAGGRFEFTGLRDDPYRISASPPGSQQQRGPRRGGEEVAVGQLDVELVLEARGAIKGKVAFADGEAPGAFSVSSGRGFRAAPTPFSNKDGSFELTDLEPRGYQLRIDGPGFDGVTRGGVQVEAGKTVDVGTITVRQGRRVAGRVVDAGGSAVANASVVVGARLRGSGSSSSSSGGRRGSRTQQKATTTDDAGEFVLSGIGEDELALVAEHPSKGRSVALSLPRSPESSIGITIVLEAPGALVGTVTSGDIAADSVRVTAQSKSATGATFTVSSGDDGKYRFDVLAPDVYQVSASQRGRGRGFGSISKTVTIEAGKTATVDLRFAAGTGSLEVSASAPGDGLGFGLVSLLDTTVTVKTAAALETFMATREGGFSARGAIVGGEAARFDKLEPGDYTACIVALPDEVVGPAAFEYLDREGASLAIACKAVAVGAGEASVAVPVTVPDFVPPPTP